MTGPFNTYEENSADLANPMETMSNQILGYLFGFNPKIEVDDAEEKKKQE